MPKVKLSLTLDSNIAKEIEDYYRQRLRDALDKNAEELPKITAIFEKCLIMGWQDLKKQNLKKKS